MRGVFLFVLLLLVAQNYIRAQEIVFYTSAPVNASGIAAIASRDLIGGINIAFSRINSNTYLKTDAFTNKSLTLKVMDDGGDLTRVYQNYQQMVAMPSTQMLGIVAPSDYNSSNIASAAINSTNIPLIAPLTGTLSIRTSGFLRNIINLRPSYADELNVMVNYLIVTRSLSRVGFYFPNNTFGMEGLISVNASLKAVSYQLTSLFAYDPTNVTNVGSAVKTFVFDQPDAIIVWATPEAYLPFISAVKVALPNCLIFKAYSPNPSVDTTFGDYFSCQFFPNLTSVTNNSLALQYKSDYETYGGFNATLHSLNTIEGYIIGLYIGSVIQKLEIMGPNALSDRSAFLSAAYSTPMIKVAELTLGPIGDNCNIPDAGFGCCNQLRHVIQLGNTTNSNITTTRWSTCISSQKKLPPINFGRVSGLDTTSNQGLQGIIAAFNYLNNQPTRAGVRPLQLINYVVTNLTESSTSIALFKQINNQTDSLSFLEVSDALATQHQPWIDNNTAVMVDVVSSNDLYRFPFKQNWINLRVSVKDKTMTIFGYLLNTKFANETRTVRVAVYYNAPEDAGGQFFGHWKEQLRIFKTYDPPFRLSFLEVFEVFTNDTDVTNSVKRQLVDAGLDTTEDPIDLLVVSTKDQNYDKVAQGIRNITLAFHNPRGGYVRPFDVILTSGSQGTGQNITAVTFNITGIRPMALQTIILSGQTLTGIFKRDITLGADYQAAAAALGYPPTEGGTGAYMASIFVSEVVARINGPVNRASFLATVYSNTVFYVSGIPFGPFYINSATSACNSGVHSCLLVQYAGPGKLNSIYTHTWPEQSCGTSYFFGPPVTPNATILTTNQGSSNKNTALIVGVVVGGVLCILFVLCALIAVLLFFALYNRAEGNKKKRDLKEPKYSDYAIKEKFLDRGTIESLFISSTPSASAAKTREMLARIERLIMDPAKAYVIIQAMCKAGLAREDVAACVVYIYHNNKSVDKLLAFGVGKEIVHAESEATLFREDSILSAIWIAYTKLVGLSYLWNCLAEALYDILELTNKNYDAYTVPKKKSSLKSVREGRKQTLSSSSDSEGSDSSDDHLVNVLHLRLGSQMVFNMIKQTEFPMELTQFLTRVKKKVKKQYPDLAIGMIANFVFMKFLCLAVTAPASFGLCRKQPNAKTIRFLVLMSKVLQFLSFGMKFEKEVNMSEMNDFIESNKESCDQWLDSISNGSTESTDYVVVDVSDVVKNNCLKWLYWSLYSNRQVLRRELTKKLEDENWEEIETELEEVGVLRAGSDSSASFDSTHTEMDEFDTAGGHGEDKSSDDMKESDLSKSDDEEDEVETKGGKGKITI